jgi:hypothetical protein
MSREERVVQLEAENAMLHEQIRRLLRDGAENACAGSLVYLLEKKEGKGRTGVNPSDQTTHEVKNVGYWYQRIPEEKSDERKGSQPRIQMNGSASAGQWRKTPSPDLP